MLASLTLLILLAAAWFFSHGFILYYGDAQAHLNISRSLIDSRTPGYDQIGTVWLPVLHLICLPFVLNTQLWSSGLAGAIPVSICFVIAGFCFYFAAKEIYGTTAAATVVLASFALNPNLLYLSSIPMTEVVFLTALAVLMLSAVRFRATQRLRYVALGVIASWSMSLTRYDGWFLIPFAAVWFAYYASRRRLFTLIFFGALASLAPFYWMAHNFWETGNALDFYNGPYSAKAIQGAPSYPGYRDLPLAIHYYSKAAQLCTGWTLLLLGALGFVCLCLKKQAIPAAFLLLTPAFYVWSMYSSGGTPIFIPQFWPHGYYNSRYGIAVLAFSAFAAGGLVYAAPLSLKRFSWAIPLLAVLPWIFHPSRQSWIIWKESEQNSISRRAWTEEAAKFLRSHNSGNQQVLMRFGDLTGILCRNGTSLQQNLSQNNGAEWEAAITRPDLIHSPLYAIAQKGDAISESLTHKRSPYRLVEEFETKDAPVLQIFERVEQVNEDRN